MKRAIIALLLAQSFTVPAFADSNLFSFELPNEPARPRNTWLPPLASFFLPGFDQWWEGQYGSAASYTGTALVGSVIATQALTGDSVSTDLSSRETRSRNFILGNQLYMAAGSFSAYHSFRSAVKSRQANGEYGFLVHTETTDELLGAAFRFQEITKPSTWIPLAGGLILAGLSATQDGAAFHHNGFSGTDLAYAGGFSYLAGSNEEALFRGFLMPLMMESWQSEFWSNTAQSLLFAAAHIGSDNPVPWPQLVGGWYLGYLTQQNQWSLKQSIFIHTWWDVIAFTASYLHESRDPNYRNMLFLPAVSF